MAGTPEYRAVKTTTEGLVDGIAVDVFRYAVNFRDEELITDTVYDTAIDTKIKQDNAGRARDIVQNITAKVRANPESTFPKLLNVLRYLNLTDLADRIENKIGDAAPSVLTGGGNTKTMGLSKSRLDENIDDGKLWDIAKLMGRNWEECLTKLGVPSKEIDDIKEDYKGANNQRFQALRAWRQKKGPRATFRALVEVLNSIKDEETVTSIHELLK